MTSSATRAQHLIPAVAILALAGTVVWLSYAREPASALLFPRLLSTVMLVFAGWNFVRAALGLARVGDGFEASELVAILPGVAVTLVYILFAAKWLGFYVASFGASWFSILCPTRPRISKPSTWLRRLIITTGFMLMIYGLFSMLLKIQTPRGLYF